jgi:hypothetical protein
MRVAEVTFTHAPHQQPAADHDGGETRVRRIWCVEPKDAAMLPPRGVELWVRDFPRGGNLNGWACVAGILDVFAELFAAGAEVVVKKDSDVRVLDYPALAPPPGYCLQGVTKPTYHHWQIFGCCYALTRDALPILREALDARAYPGRRVPEDDFVALALRRHASVLPYSRAAMALSTDRSGEADPVWLNTGNPWESAEHYATRAAARRAKRSAIAIHPLPPGAQIGEGTTYRTDVAGKLSTHENRIPTPREQAPPAPANPSAAPGAPRLR